MEQNFSSNIKLLTAMARVQCWEYSNSSFLKTQSGRQIYFGIIRHLAQNGELLSVGSMKEIYCDDGIQLTERGVRLGIRSFEASGLLVVEQAGKDKRSRQILLTDEFRRQMLEHANVIKNTLSENFLVLEK